MWNYYQNQDVNIYHYFLWLHPFGTFHPALLPTLTKSLGNYQPSFNHYGWHFLYFILMESYWMYSFLSFCSLIFNCPEFRHSQFLPNLTFLDADRIMLHHFSKLLVASHCRQKKKTNSFSLWFFKKNLASPIFWFYLYASIHHV